MKIVWIKSIATLTSLLLVSIAQMAVAQSGTGAVLASVNGNKIYASQVNEIVSMVVADGGKDTPELRQTLLNDLVIREAISQDVKKTGLLEKDSNALKLKLARRNTVLEIWFGVYMKTHPVTESEIKAEYDRRLAFSKEPKNAKQYEVSQIMLTTQAEGEDIIKQINSGAKFEVLAKERSIDKNTGIKGGLVGWVFSSQLTPPINDAVPNLGKGKITQNPIQTGNGWHVIKVNDVRPFELLPFDQLQNNIAQELTQQRRNVAVSALLQESKVTKGK